MYYYNNELPPQQGWVCPKCGRVNAPWLPTCGCVSSQTSGTPYLVETSSISRDSHEIAKTENSSEKPNNCEELNAYRKCVESRSFWDNKHCDGCYFDERCPFEPKDEPQPTTDCRQTEREDE